MIAFDFIKLFYLIMYYISVPYKLINNINTITKLNEI